MRIVPLNCANCGAPLEVSAKIRYFTGHRHDLMKQIERAKARLRTTPPDDDKPGTEQP